MKWFRTFNKCLLVEAQAKKFAVNMRPVQPFTQSNMLLLVILKEDMDDTCYLLSPNVEKAPFLKLRVRVAERHGYQLKFAGGQHCHWAMQIKQDESRELVMTI